MVPGLRSAIVVLHQLPVIPETLWLRILGKVKVQRQAIDSLEALPKDDSNRSATLRLLLTLREHLEVRQQLDEAERDLVMRLAPLFDEKLSQKFREGEQLGQQLIVENLLGFRFGELDDELAGVVPKILALPPEELNRLLLQLSQVSREELLARFPKQN